MFLSIMSLVITINIYGDAEDLYGSSQAQEYVTHLVKSKMGLPENVNERDLKTVLATEIDTECYLIGSSHVMSISIFDHNFFLSEDCPNLVNLGVSGAGLEDALIFSELIKERKQTIIFGIDPWTFKTKMDTRYGRFLEILEKRLHDLHDNASDETVLVLLHR